jgi:cell division protein FtsW
MIAGTSAAAARRTPGAKPPRPRPPRPGPPARAPSGPRGHRPWPLRLAARLDTPLASYYLVLGATVALVVIGLVMVLSSSSVESYRKTESPYTVFSRQALFAAVGLPLAMIATRLPVAAWKALGWPMLGVVLVCLALVVFSPLGKGVNGNRNWIVIGGLTLQPSEAAKLAIVVWSAAVLSRKRPLLHRTAHLLVPVLPVTGVLLVLVLLGHDVGTGLILLALIAALLFVAGAPLRLFVLGGSAAGFVLWQLVSSRASRLERVQAWFGGECADPTKYQDQCWQAVHGQWALASGSWWGVGLGASREKWSWLPEAHNDFIFAIIGEELGLVGTLVVLALFAALGIGLFRIMARSDDLFVKIATSGVLVWVLGQAVINMGAVTGLAPIVGVPLPLVSSGGSALVVTMVALAMVIGFARREPAAAEALAARGSLVRRSLAVLPVRRPG